MFREVGSVRVLNQVLVATKTTNFQNSGISENNPRESSDNILGWYKKFSPMHDELNDELVCLSLFVVCCGGLDRAGAELPNLAAPTIYVLFSNRGNSSSPAQHAIDTPNPTLNRFPPWD